MFFWLEPKEPKVQGLTNAPLFVRPTHKDSDYLHVVFVFVVIGRSVSFVLCEATEGAAFSLAFFIELNFILQAKKRRYYFPYKINE